MEHFKKLEDIMAQLRSKDGCPWDMEQTHETLKICLMEETAEVLDAIDSCDDPLLLEELGDLLLQVVFHSQIAKEEGRFTLKDVVEAISNKLIRRHPHVFGDKECADADAVISQWEAIKQGEKKDERKSAMDGIPPHMGSLHRAEKAIGKAKKANIAIELPTPKLDSFNAIMENSATEKEIAELLFAINIKAAEQGLHAEDLLRSYTTDFINNCRELEK